MLQIRSFEALNEMGGRSIELAEKKANAFLRTLMTDDVVNVQTQTFIKPREMGDGRARYYTHHIVTVVYRE